MRRKSYILATMLGLCVVAGCQSESTAADLPTSTPVITATAIPTAANTATPTVEPTATNTPIPTATNTPTPTATSTPIPTATNTPVPTATSTPKPTATSTPKPTATNTPKPTATSTPIPTATSTPKPTATPKPEGKLESWQEWASGYSDKFKFEIINPSESQIERMGLIESLYTKYDMPVTKGIYESTSYYTLDHLAWQESIGWSNNREHFDKQGKWIGELSNVNRFGFVESSADGKQFYSSEAQQWLDAPTPQMTQDEVDEIGHRINRMGWFLEYEYALESAGLGVGQYETVGQNPWDEHPVTHLLKSDTTALVVYRVSEDVIAECYITVEDAEKPGSTDGFIPFVKASVARDYTCATVEELVEFLQEVCVKVGDISYLYRKE